MFDFKIYVSQTENNSTTVIEYRILKALTQIEKIDNKKCSIKTSAYKT